ncbi:MAG: hypothetical protein ACRCX2_24205 [Paraclostridium sp.]
MKKINLLLIYIFICTAIYSHDAYIYKKKKYNKCIHDVIRRDNRYYDGCYYNNPYDYAYDCREAYLELSRVLRRNFEKSKVKTEKEMTKQNKEWLLEIEESLKGKNNGNKN